MSGFHRNCPIILFIIVALMSTFFGGCLRDRTGVTDPAVDDGSQTPAGRWISGIPFVVDGREIRHDNRIYESANYLVFSDSAGEEVRIKYSEMAEETWVAVMDSFGVADAGELGIVNQNSKITIYANRGSLSYQVAFDFGFILRSLDHRIWIDWLKTGYHDEMDYKRMVKHENMHVMERLLLEGQRKWTDIWFAEGIAEYICGGYFTPITNMGQVNAWLDEDGHINPISIHTQEDFPSPYSGELRASYFPMFGLAVTYLLDDRGLGRSLMNVKSLLQQMARYHSFDFKSAFEMNMGISLDYYEREFFGLIEVFLNDLNQAEFEPH